MIIIKIDHYDKAEARLRLIGFPAEAASPRWILSNKTEEKLSGMKGPIWVAFMLPLVFFALTAATFGFTISQLANNPLATVAAFGIGGIIGIETWHYLCLLIVKHDFVTPWLKRTERIRAIIDEDMQDKKLAEKINRLLERTNRINANDLRPDPDSKINPKGDEAQWLVHGVQYHRPSGEALAGRDVTLTFVSNKNTEDVLVAVLPSEDTILHWFKWALGNLHKQFRGGRHCADVIRRINFSLLKNVWTPGNGVLEQIGLLEVDASLPIEDRRAVTIHASKLKDGSYLLEAFEATDARAVIAPLAPLLHTGKQIKKIISHNGDNPALIQQA